VYLEIKGLQKKAPPCRAGLKNRLNQN